MATSKSQHKNGKSLKNPYIYIYMYIHSIYSRMIIYIHWLVVWNMNIIFPYIRNFIIPTDEVIFFRGVGIPPTRYNLL